MAQQQKTMTLDEALRFAVGRHQAGQFEQAAQVYRQVLNAAPQNIDALQLLGVACQELGKFDEGIEYLKRAIKLQPDNAGFLSNLGVALIKQDRPEEAIDAYIKAIKLTPNNASLHGYLGNAYLRLDLFDDAIKAYRNALKLSPQHAAAHNNLGNALMKHQEFVEAESHFREAIRLQPDMASAHNNLGNTLREQGHLGQAVASCEHSIELKPEVPEAHNNLAYALMEQRRMDEATAKFKHAIEMDPDYARAHNNLAVTQLLIGDFDNGWPEYEWRMECKEFLPCKRPFTLPHWDGTSLDGKSILIWGEQGVGDEIMFAGLLPELIEAGADCVVECEPRHVPLFGRSFPEVRCVGKEDPPNAMTVQASISYQSPMGSLPRWLRPNRESFSESRIGYLKADDDTTRQLRDRYESLPGNRIVGISWRSGNLQAAHKRSAGLDRWSKILNTPNITWVNLQYGDCTDDLTAVKDSIGIDIHHDDQVDPLEDMDMFASQVAAMDLVISIDNATVHMAGALGRPVWTLLPYVPEWRWTLEGESSPWYPSMRLFRQAAPNDWDSVFAAVKSAIDDLE